MSDESDKDREGWFGIGKWWYASAAFVLCIALALVVIFLLPSNHKKSTSTPASTDTSSAAPVTAPSSRPSATKAASGWADTGCNGTKGSDEIPAEAPSAKWVPVGAASIPTSSTYGASEVHGAVRRCFQHSPTGALFAAATLLTNFGANPNSSSAIAEAGMTPGAARDRIFANPDNEQQAQTVTAFRVDACTPARCNIDLIYSVLGGRLIEGTQSYVWQGGDWLLDVDALMAQGGDGSQLVTQVPAGFVSWGQ